MSYAVHVLNIQGCEAYTKFVSSQILLRNFVNDEDAKLCLWSFLLIFVESMKHKQVKYWNKQCNVNYTKSNMSKW